MECHCELGVHPAWEMAWEKQLWFRTKGTLAAYATAIDHPAFHAMVQRMQEMESTEPWRNDPYHGRL